MMDLARNFGNGPVLMQTIADNQGISRKYLHALLTLLKAKGLVRSVRGAGGGYVLARPPAKIKVREIVEVLEGTLAVSECSVDPSSCPRASHCVGSELWSEINQAIINILDKITVEDLIKSANKKERDNAMFHI